VPGLMRRQRGDTIIEVLIAVTVFAMVAVGAMSIMNQGTGTAQRSLEITQVRQQIDAQAEALRFVHQSYVAQFQRGAAPTGKAALWTEIMQNEKATASNFGVQNGQCPLGNGQGVPNAFALNARKVEMAPQPTGDLPNGGSFPPFAQVAYRDDSSVEAVYGLWIEAVRGESTEGPDYVDFHIRACWDSPGSDVPVTLGTIVRLYEPR
jgi:prepilin-type N-terminal cleavage/methylation domain-containing protein